MELSNDPTGPSRRVVAGTSSNGRWRFEVYERPGRFAACRHVDGCMTTARTFDNYAEAHAFGRSLIDNGPTREELDERREIDFMYDGRNEPPEDTIATTPIGRDDDEMDELDHIEADEFERLRAAHTEPPIEPGCPLDASRTTRCHPPLA